MSEVIDTAAAYEALTKQKQRSSEWKHNWFVLQTLVTRDFKRKYRRSFLGVAWSVLNPLLMMIVMAAVFSYMFKFEVPNYPLYLILGSIMFEYMRAATNDAMFSITEAEALIKKIRIEKMVFPFEKILFALVNFAISLIAAAIVLVFFIINPGDSETPVLITPHIIWGLPFLVLCVGVFSAGLGLLLSALSVFFRDIMHLWGVVLTAWTYATPIFYPYSLLASWMQAVMQFNPMYHYITFFRDITMWGINPGVAECGVCAGMAVLTFLVGFIVFRKTEHKFILYI